jgi:NAD(P)H dehydrogenase (quinone)
VLTTDGHEHTTYDITGPEGVSSANLAALFAELSGRSVRVVDIGDRTLAWMLTRFGTPKPVAQAVVAFGRSIREGYFDVIDPAFEDLCGRTPVSLREVLMPYRDELMEAA